jgi:ribonucleoside-diphosphate reductase alpha chain
MAAVADDSIYDLVNPRTGLPMENVKARAIMEDIVRHAHGNGEPGVLFMDTINRRNPVPNLYKIETTNPCGAFFLQIASNNSPAGEQALGPYENCCLGSVNLARFVVVKEGKLYGSFDWAGCAEAAKTAVRFLDDVVTVNSYIPAVPELREAAWRVRRIGLGFMGLADVLYAVGARYGARDGLVWTSALAEWVHYHAMLASIELAQDRGPFPAISGSIYDSRTMLWHPVVHHAFRDEEIAIEIGCPKLDWSIITEGIKKCGIRNGAVTTVAPTGTVGTVAGVEGYGIEPAFALGYTRTVKQPDGTDSVLRYASKLFERAMMMTGGTKEAIDKSVARGSCQGVDGVPPEVQHVFVTAGDITAQGHIHTQACVQQYFSNSISKTINFPETATVDDVLQAYILAHKLGCCGLTVYVAGSRTKEVLKTEK